MTNLISQLSKIATYLTDQITVDLMGVAELVRACQDRQGIDLTVGSLASISYRLCEAYKATVMLGYRVQKAISADAEGQPLNTGDLLDDITGTIERVCDGNLCFLTCDVETLRAHPEIEKAPAVGKTLDLVRDQIGKIDERLYEIAEEAEVLLQHQPANPLAKGPEPDDPAWKLMQAILSECLTKAQQRRKRERQVTGPMVHPKLRENGKPHVIDCPTQPSSPSTWLDGTATAIFVPGGKSPSTLNNVDVGAWYDQPKSDAGWNALDLFMPVGEEPPAPTSHLALASGVVIVEPDKRFWLVAPTNGFGGYKTTFPKGKLDGAQLSLQANAVKEAVEESGLKVRITGYLGDFKRTTSMTRLYLAERVGGDPCDMGWESQAVLLVPLADLPKLLQAPADKPVLAAILEKFKG